jgi:hypothetical protein
MHRVDAFDIDVQFSRCGRSLCVLSRVYSQPHPIWVFVANVARTLPHQSRPSGYYSQLRAFICVQEACISYKERLSLSRAAYRNPSAHGVQNP